MQSGYKYTTSLVRKTSLSVAATTLCGTSIMYFFGSQAIQLTIIAGGLCALTSLLALFIYVFPHNKANPLILIVGCMVAILLPTFFSGGVNSRFVVLIPILPVITSLILSRRSAITLTSLVIAFIIFVGVFEKHIPDFSYLNHISQETFPKTLWLVLAVIFSLTFSLIFSGINASLTIQLESKRELNESVLSKERIIDFADKSLLKLNTSSAQDKQLAIFIISVVPTNEEEQERVKHRFIKSANKVLKNENDMLGHHDHTTLLACVNVTDNNDANALAEKLISQFKETESQHANKINSTVNIGLISVGANVGVDIHSLVSVASMALRRATESGDTEVVNYQDIKA